MVNNHGTIITVAVPSIQHQPDGGDSSPGHTAATVVGRARGVVPMVATVASRGCYMVATAAGLALWGQQLARSKSRDRGWPCPAHW